LFVSQSSPSGPPILIDAGRFRARSVRAADATQAIADWFADPDRVGPLNLPPRVLSLADLRRLFDSFDNRTRFLVALIDRKAERVTGFVHVEFSPLHRVSRVAFLNGPNDLTARRALVAISRPFLADQFRRLGAEKIVSQILLDNLAMCGFLDQLGFQREGLLRAQVRKPGGGRLDQVFFGLLPGELSQPYRRQ
jgi:RimJ/RimL family protein N-acetyltransferase